MNRRLLLVGSAVGLFATIAIRPMPAAATPCTDLKSLQLKHTTITSAEDNTTGNFTVPNSGNPPIILTGLPAFCRVTATLTPMSDSTIQHRGLAAGDDVERQVRGDRRRRLPGADHYQRVR
jgi:feruloyl esterase